MIQKFVKAWDANKASLEEHLKTHRMEEYDEYDKLVKLLFEIVINPYISTQDETPYDVEKMTVIDDGEYQGTQLFVLPKDTYQPSAWEYVITNQYYGSCSGCDLLQGITQYESGQPDSEQLDELMTLCLHLLQRCKIPFSYDED